MKIFASGIFLAFLAAGSSTPAQAAHWNVDYSKSHLGFTVAWSNEPFTAEFKHWTANIDFDPADLTHAHAAVQVDIGSEASDEPDFDSGVKGAQGFLTSKYPDASFVTTGFTRKSANSYVANGTLTIRGITRNITLPFALAISGNTAHMTGTSHVMRADFGVGQGQWAAPNPVANDVSITIDLTASQ
jgi:polyisoprenoid-binding protein YceI